MENVSRVSEGITKVWRTPDKEAGVYMPQPSLLEPCAVKGARF